MIFIAELLFIFYLSATKCVLHSSSNSRHLSTHPLFFYYLSLFVVKRINFTLSHTFLYVVFYGIFTTVQFLNTNFAGKLLADCNLTFHLLSVETYLSPVETHCMNIDYYIPDTESLTKDFSEEAMTRLREYILMFVKSPAAAVDVIDIERTVLLYY